MEEKIEKNENAEKENTGNTEMNPEGMEKENPEGGEELESSEEILKNPTEGAEVSEEKSKINRKKIACCVELVAAFILLVLSGGLFLNTRGTMLLYVSVATGRVSRFYWIFFMAAVVFMVIGLFTLKRLRAGK